METNGKRLPKPVAGDLRIHKVYAGPERWLEIAARAERAGMSVSAYLNALIERDEVDETGTPSWAAERAHQTAQLPLSTLHPAA